jgi:hypothetical protein
VLGRSTGNSKKLNAPKINDLMRKWANESNRVCSKDKVQMAKKTHEKVPTVPGRKANANQDYNKVPPYFC